MISSSAVNMSLLSPAATVKGYSTNLVQSVVVHCQIYSTLQNTFQQEYI